MSASATQLSSRAQPDDSHANHPAQSRDLASATSGDRPQQEFSRLLSNPEVRGRNASKRQLMVLAESRSLDSARDDEVGMAQDGRVGKVLSGVLQTDPEVFRAFVAAGKRLAEIHVNYEQQSEYPLTKTEKAGEKLDWRITKMRLSKDKTSLIYNQFLTLSGIPPQTYDYRLGNRSALEWVIDQYQVSTDKRSGIVNDPNRTDDPHYIVRLIGQVVTVSLETVKIVDALPKLCICPEGDQSVAIPAGH